MFAIGLPAANLIPHGARKKAPQFELASSDGQMVRLADYAGQVVLVDFWATWCGPCKSSIPWMAEMSKQLGSEGLRVVGVSMDEQGWSAVKPFLEKMPIPYPVVLGNKRVAYLYGDIDALPVAFFIDRNQRVAAIHLGAASRKDFEKTVRTLLNETPTQNAPSGRQ